MLLDLEPVFREDGPCGAFGAEALDVGPSSKSLSLAAPILKDSTTTLPEP